MKTVAAWLLVIAAAAAPAAAQPARRPPARGEPSLSFRPYVAVADQQFAAQQTFKAAFGNAMGLFVGAGVEVDSISGLFLDVSVSRMQKKGQRAFIFNGQTFPLGIALTSAVTPIEAAIGYRIRLGSALTPYLGAGVGSYGYSETSDFSESGDDVSARKTGFLFVVGADVRLQRFFSVSVDVEGRSVTGILGSSGLSQQTGEKDLGGIAARFRVLIGR